MIDPLDGTTNYLYGHPGYAISIAIARGDDDPGRGVVDDPIHDERFTAVRGRGATRNGEPIASDRDTSSARPWSRPASATTPDQRDAQVRVLAELIGSIRDIRRMGAAAVDLCSVACGRVDAFYERGLNHWDLAAGALIAAEAGARVGAIGGGDGVPGIVVAATGAVRRAACGRSARVTVRTRAALAGALHRLDRELRGLGRALADPHALRLERLLLRLGGARGAGDDRPGVAHLLARRRGEAGDVGDHRLGTDSAMKSAARSSASPPISPTMTIISVSGSSSNRVRMSMKSEPTIGSPPMPTIEELPIPACLSSLPIW